MSYDLMVFEASKAPKDRKEFMEWYIKQTQWSEEHDYNDQAVSSPSLTLWFEEMAKNFPPMNGPLSTDDCDNPKITDYSIGRDVIYSAFSWEIAEEAYPKVRELAIKHSVGFFDVSADNGEILFPPEMIEETIKKPYSNSNRGALDGATCHSILLWINVISLLTIESILIFSPWADNLSWFLALPIIFFSFFILLHYLLKRGLQKEKTSARIGSIIYGFLIILGFPLGTIFGIILIYSMTKKWKKSS